MDNSNTNSVSGGLSNAANTSAARTNVEELGVLIPVLYEADDIVWKEIPAQNKLIAVFRFPPPVAARLVEDASKFGPSQTVRVSVESWFPDELVAQSDMSGDSDIQAIAYPANSFFQAPYTSGKIARIDDGNYFVLELLK